ncbi:hypothetical protein EDD18DRAFT_1079001 [Armillaria luteobubalina]|uniref:Uncharacterized protein n=1 Tax=Armillaria luteobubalina TaxID=153913 RepID=A0AA39PYA9_9AGAR|nr:hypothetical protein EDD18DRAFT_1081535 [Armillaria luteobubalina]KAK0492828.1 hypothetical protein EDD18DRAFT_1079001 [Armillaria luteobubalina]
MVFTLTVSNDAGKSSDQVVININPGPTVDSITIEEASWKSGKGSGTLTVIASTNVASSQLFATDPDVDTIAMTSLGSGRFQALVSIRPSPVLVTITSSLGASVTVPVS